MGQDMVQIERAELRRIAVRRRIRLGFGMGEVPNGGSCVICKGEWGHDRPEDHALTCPLFVAAIDTEQGTRT